MAKGREKQRAHAASSITKEERLAMEATQREAEEVARKEAEEAARKEAEEETSLYDFCGLKDPTPYRAFKNIDRRNRDTARVIRKRAVASI